MSIEWFRDLVICILGLGAVVGLILLSIVLILFYRKVSPLLDSAKKAAKNVENLSEVVEAEVARPLAQVAALVQGVTQGVRMINRFGKKREGGRNE